MLSQLRFLPLLPLAALLGCALPTTSSSTAPPQLGPSANWQIQAGTAITSPPTGISFTGAVETQGTQSAAVFTALTGLPTPSNPTQVLDFLGTYNSSTGAINLFPAASGPYIFALSFTPSSSNTVVPVAVTGGCVYPLNYQGPECLAITAVPSVGVEIAPLNGTYTGTLTDSSSPSLSGTATLTLTQSATPNSSGQFPLSGTLTFPAGSNFGTVSLGGTVSGEGIALSDSSAAPNSPTANVTASTNPTGVQITISNLTYSNAGPGAVIVYTGTLTHQ